MAGKPAFQFYPGDWLKDPDLSLCTPATRGVWMDLLCAMHERDRCGVIAGTREQLARVSRCSAVEFGHAIADLQATGAADVTERDKIVTVICRRMKAESEERNANATRQKRHRTKIRDGPENGAVTEKSRSPSSSSSSSSTSKSRKGSGIFKCVDSGILRDGPKLLAWYRTALTTRGPPFADDERDLLWVFGCAVRAVELGKNPPAMFAALVGKRDRGKISNAQEEKARLMIREARGSPPRMPEEEPEFASVRDAAIAKLEEKFGT